MKNKFFIGLVLVLGIAGYFGYDYYMTKIPVSVELIQYRNGIQYKEHYPLSQVLGVSGNFLKLKDGTRSDFVSFHYLINREGSPISLEGTIQRSDLSSLAKHLVD